MMRLIQVILLLLTIACTSPIARADIDYACLSACAHGGDTQSVCLPKCTYGIAPEPLAKTPKAAIKSPHNEFSPLIPNHGEIILPAHPVAPATNAKDYSCMAPCLQKGSQYQFCEKQCAPASALPGALAPKKVNNINQ